MKISVNLLHGGRKFLAILFLAACLGVVVPTPQALACSGSCATDTDCTGACKYCNTDFGVCSDCCEFTDAVTCPSACNWSGTECQNVAGSACGVLLPETPRSFRNYFFIALFIGLVGAGLLGKIWMRRRSRPQSGE